MKKIFTLLTIALILGSLTVNSQELPDFRKNPVVYFRFSIAGRTEISDLTRIISIDNVKGNDVWAYANQDEFNAFVKTGHSWTILQLPGEATPESELRMGDLQKDSKGRTIWNFYPTYQQYLDLMAGFALDYPEICKVDTIGTTGQGRLLLAVKISDSVQEDQSEPEILLTSSIHGDETTGYVLMLHLIDSLLTSYNINDRITDMVNNNQLYINPLANPDGTYHGGNNSVSGAWRYNASSVDCNRNFPDPKVGPHPDGKQWQQETKMFMHFDTIHDFTISMNFHGGAEVFNYPWDTWVKLHPDNNWLDYIGREYADTVHLHAPSNYMRDLDNGVTNGNAWYEINGGRQDYTTYFHHGREITLEISSTKLLPASQLLNYWGYNKRSFLNFIDQALYGVNGQVTDTLTGEPLKAKVMIQGHDFDNSFVYTDSLHGWYYRPIEEGNWGLTFTCPGYFTKTVNVDVQKWTTIRNNVSLVPLTYGIGEHAKVQSISVFPNPSKGKVNFIMPTDRKADVNVMIFATNGAKVKEMTFSQVQGNPVLGADLGELSDGIYLVEVKQDKNIYQARIQISR